MAKLTRNAYIPKAFDAKISDKETGAIAYLFQFSGKPAAVWFGGKRQKPDGYWTFPSTESRAQALRKFFDSEREKLEAKKAKRANRSTGHDFSVGDFLVSAWGYDQTNIDFYKVTRVTKASVEIVKVANKKVGKTDEASVTVVPGEKTCGASKLKRVDSYGCVRISSFQCASKWDGTPRHETAFGYGH